MLELAAIFICLLPDVQVLASLSFSVHVGLHRFEGQSQTAYLSAETSQLE